MFEYLIPSWKNCLGRIKKYELVRGGVSLGGFKASDDSQYSQCILSVSCLQVKMWALSCSSQHEFCLLPRCSATMDCQPSETLSPTKHFQNCFGHNRQETNIYPTTLFPTSLNISSTLHYLLSSFMTYKHTHKENVVFVFEFSLFNLTWWWSPFMSISLQILWFHFYLWPKMSTVYATFSLSRLVPFHAIVNSAVINTRCASILIVCLFRLLQVDT